MKNILAFALTLSLFASCNKKEDLDKLETVNESFSFQGIKYAIIDDSSNVITSFDVPSITFSNGSNLEIKFPYNPLAGYDNEVSQFISDDFESFAKFNDLEVYVPSYIDENNMIHLGAKKWKYSDAVQKQSLDIATSSDVTIPPNTTVVMHCKIFFSNYKLNYQLMMRGDITGTYRIAEGIWTGTFLDHTEINISTSSL